MNDGVSRKRQLPAFSFIADNTTIFALKPFTMFLIILGLAAFFAASGLSKLQSPFPNYTIVICIAASRIIVVGILNSCIIQIDAGQVAVQILFGKFKMMF